MKIPMFLALVLLFGCGYYQEKPASGQNPPVEQEEPATYKWIAKNIIGPSCLKCHNQGSPTGLEFQSYDAIMASGTVVAGKPWESSFYTALAKGSMPKKAAKLPDDQIDAVYEWILNGAQNN